MMPSCGSKFDVDEKVQVIEKDIPNGKFVAETKVLSVITKFDEFGNESYSYLILFKGLNSSWCKVVPEESILPDCQESRLIIRNLRAKYINGTSGKPYQCKKYKPRLNDIVEQDDLSLIYGSYMVRYGPRPRENPVCVEEPYVSTRVSREVPFPNIPGREFPEVRCKISREIPGTFL